MGLIGLLGLLLSPLVGAGQSKFELGLTAGRGLWLSDAFGYARIYLQASSSYNRLSKMEQSVSINMVYGLSAQYNLSSRFGLQAEMQRFGGRYEALFLLDPGPAESRIKQKMSSNRLTWNVWTVFLNAVFRSGKTDETPSLYWFVGLGICALKGGEDRVPDYRMDIPSTVDAGIQAGGGFAVPLPMLSPVALNLRIYLLVLRAEASDTGDFYAGEGVFYAPYGGGGLVSGGYNTLLAFDAGMTFRF